MNDTLHSAFGWQRRVLVIGAAVMILSVGAGVFAAIASGTATTASSTQVTITQVVLAKPSSVANGDVMIASIAINGVSTATTTAPSGWTQIASTENDVHLRVISYWKVAGGSEPSTYTWTIDGQTTAQGAILPFTGVSISSPIDVAAGNTGFGVSATTTSVTTSVDNAELIAVFATEVGKNADAGAHFTTPSGMTEKYDTSNVPNGPSIAGDVDVQTSAGSSGSKSSTISPGNKARYWVTQIIALRPAPAACTGGTITTSGGQTIHTFTASGTLDCSAAGQKIANVLVVGGGGGAGQAGSGTGGGGGGGYQYVPSYTVLAQSYSVTVGAGGATGSGDSNKGSNGSSSSFGTTTAIGGGGGAAIFSDGVGLNGGSGGGGGSQSGGSGGTGSQGNDGGDGTTDAGGGGGGAGAAGNDGVASPSSNGGNGGAGLANSISGSSVYYSGGGAGAGGGTTGTGGIGGGGDEAEDGEPNTGGGAGPRVGTSGGNGGSGVVIISYPAP